VVCLPIANKLKNKSTNEVYVKEAIIEGVLSIQSGDNPRIVQEKLKSFLPPKERMEIAMPSKTREVSGRETLDAR
jgi:chemotaxis protein MotA